MPPLGHFASHTHPWHGPQAGFCSFRSKRRRGSVACGWAKRWSRHTPLRVGVGIYNQGIGGCVEAAKAGPSESGARPSPPRLSLPSRRRRRP